MKKIVTMIAAALFCGCYGGYNGSYRPVAVAPMPAMAAPMGPMGGYMVPPPPPPGVAFVNGHGYPGQWDGPNRVKILNTSHYFVRVRMDGREVRMADQMVGLPLLPPRQEAFIFVRFNQINLDSGCERHHFEFEGYLPANPRQPVARSSAQYCLSPSRSDGSIVEISNLCFAGYC